MNSFPSVDGLSGLSGQSGPVGPVGSPGVAGGVAMPNGSSLEDLFADLLLGKVQPSTEILILAERWRAQRHGILAQYDQRRAAFLKNKV